MTRTVRAAEADTGMGRNAHRSALMVQGRGLSTLCPPSTEHQDTVPLHSALAAQGTDTGMVRNAHRSALLTRSTGLWAAYTLPFWLTAWTPAWSEVSEECPDGLQHSNMGMVLKS